MIKINLFESNNNKEQKDDNSEFRLGEAIRLIKLGETDKAKAIEELQWYIDTYTNGQDSWFGVSKEKIVDEYKRALAIVNGETTIPKVDEANDIRLLLKIDRLYELANVFHILQDASMLSSTGDGLAGSYSIEDVNDHLETQNQSSEYFTDLEEFEREYELVKKLCKLL